MPQYRARDDPPTLSCHQGLIAGRRRSAGSLGGHATQARWYSTMTLVLIHGGGTTARFWDRLVPLLPPSTLALDLPGRAGHPAELASLSVEEEVASVVDDLHAADLEGAITLVAHSSGGLVVPGVVAALGGRVRSVVLNAALVPIEGGRGIDCMKERHREGLLLALAAAERDGKVITLPGVPENPESFRTSYGGDPLDDDTLAYVVDPVRCVEDTVHHYLQPVRWSDVAGVPITYVVNGKDRPIPTASQEEMARRLPQPASVVRIESGHLLPVTAPAVFARILAQVEAGTGDPESDSLVGDLE